MEVNKWKIKNEKKREREEKRKFSHLPLFFHLKQN